jgi:hypothetical protein
MTPGWYCRWGTTVLDEARRSRSQLVVDYLEARCSEEASQVSELCCLAGCCCFCHLALRCIVFSRRCMDLAAID